jgi:hypothetical protein
MQRPVGPGPLATAHPASASSRTPAQSSSSSSASSSSSSNQQQQQQQPQMLPVYDLAGRPLGNFPLAPGVDASALSSQLPPAMGGSSMNTFSGSAATPARGGIPLSSNGTAMSASSLQSQQAAVFQQWQQFQLFQQMQIQAQQLGGAAAASSSLLGTPSVGNHHHQQQQQQRMPPSTPSRSTSSTRGGSSSSSSSNVLETSAANVSNALQNMFNSKGPGGSTISAMSGSSPRQPRVNKDFFSAPKDVYTAPTPKLIVGAGDVLVPSGPASIKGQSLVPVDTPGMSSSISSTQPVGNSASAFMYSLAATGEELAEMSEARVLADTKVKELEKALSIANAKGAALQKEVETLNSEMDSKDAELKRLRRMDRASNRKPNVFAPFLNSTSSSSASSSSLAFGGSSLALDRVFQVELARKLPHLQTLPLSVLQEVVARAEVLDVPSGTSLGDIQGVKGSLLLILEGRAVCRFISASSGSGNTTTQNGEQYQQQLYSGVGEFLGENELLNRPPSSPQRDVTNWSAAAAAVGANANTNGNQAPRLVLLALNCALIRRLLLTESSLLDCWTEHSVSSAVSPAFSPLRPQPRASLHADVEFNALVKYASMHRALLHVATGRHVLSFLSKERRRLERIRQLEESVKGGDNKKDAEDGINEEDNEEEEEEEWMDENRNIASGQMIPYDIATSATIRLFLSQAYAHDCTSSTGVPSERSIETLVSAVRRYFNCMAVCLYEIDRNDISAASTHIVSASLRAVSLSSDVDDINGGAARAAIHNFLHRSSNAAAGSSVYECAISAAPFIVRDFSSTSSSSSSSPVSAMDPIATQLMASTSLSVPIFIHSNNTSSASTTKQGSGRIVCAVLQLIDKRINTASCVPPSTLRGDELPFYQSDSRFPGAVSIGWTDASPRFPFTKRDEEMVQFAASAIGDVISMSFTQAFNALNGAARVVASSANINVKKTNISDSSALISSLLKDETIDIPGLLKKDKLESKFAAANNAASSTASTSTDASISSQHTSSVTNNGLRSIPTSSVSDLLQWRVRSLHAHHPLASLASPVGIVGASSSLDALGDDDEFDAFGDAMTHTQTGGGGGGGGSRYPPPATSLINILKQTAIDGDGNVDATIGLVGDVDNNLDDIQGRRLSSNQNAQSSPLRSTFGANAKAAAALANIELPSSVYLYVRACVVQGRLPICADSCSTSARGVNGFAAGKVANGTTVIGADSAASLALAHTPSDVSSLAALTALSVGGIGAAGSASEGCTANWITTSTAAASSSATAGASINISSSSTSGVGSDSSSSSSSSSSSLLLSDSTDKRNFIDLDVRVCDLPRDSHIVFAVHEDPLFEGGGGGGGDAAGGGNCGRPLFWTSCPLFTRNSTLRTGSVLLPLRSGAWPGGAATVGFSDDDLSGSNEGVIEIDLGSVGIPPGTIAIDCDLSRNAWGHWRSVTQTLLSTTFGGNNNAASRSANNFFRGVSSAYVEALASMTGGVGGGGGGAPFADELYLGKNARGGLNGRSSSPLPPSAAAAAAQSIGAANGAVGGDTRGLEPLRVPSLQSATPNINAQAQAQQQQMQLQQQLRTQSSLSSSSALTTTRVSKGVELLTQSDLTIVRLLKGGVYAGDSFWPQRLSQPLRNILWQYRKSLVLSREGWGGSTSSSYTSSTPHPRNASLLLSMQACLPIVLKSCPSLYSTSATDANSAAYADAPSSFLYGNNDASIPGKAATHAAQLLLRQASLQFGGGKLQPFVCLQLLDSGFSDPTVRSLAAEAFAANFSPVNSTSSSSQSSPLAPFNYLFPVALASACEGSLNSVTTRTLYAMAVEEPLTIGRQLGWSYLSLMTSTGLRSRSSRLIRALTDVTDEYVTAELALQNYALSQIATACRRSTLSAARGARTAVLRRALSGIVLPPVVRLPLRALEQVIPSVFYKALNNGSLQSGFIALVKKQVDDHMIARSGGRVAAQAAASETAPSVNAASSSSPVFEDKTSSKRNSMDVDSDTDIDDDDDDEDENDTDNEFENENLDGLDDNEFGRSAFASSSKASAVPSEPVEILTPSEAALKLAQQVDDAVSLSLSTLGVFSDAAALKLNNADFRNPSRAYKALAIAADEATVDFRRNVGLLKPGARSVKELDPRLPLSGFGIRAATTSFAMDNATGSIKPSLTYGASFLSAARHAAEDEIEYLDADAQRRMDAAIRDERQAHADVETIIDTYRSSLSTGASSSSSATSTAASSLPTSTSFPSQHLPASVTGGGSSTGMSSLSSSLVNERSVLLRTAPRPIGASLPISGLCIRGDLLPNRCRVIYANPRKRYSRVVMAFPVASDPDNEERGCVSLPLPSHDDSMASVTASLNNMSTTAKSSSSSSSSSPSTLDVLRISTHVPRPIRFWGGLVHFLGITGDDPVILSEALNALLITNAGKIWREEGLPLGDAVGLYSYGVSLASSRDPAFSGPTTVTAGAGGLGGGRHVSSTGSSVNDPTHGVPLNSLAGEGVGSRLFGMLICPPSARTIAEILNVGEDTEAVAMPSSTGGGKSFYDSNDTTTVIDDRYDVGASRGGAEGGGRGGYGCNGLERWFMSNHLSSAATTSNKSNKGEENEEDEVDDENQNISTGRSLTSTGAVAVNASGGSQYTSIVSTYVHSFASIVTATYVLALGERKPADIMITPAGCVFLSGLSYTEGVPDRGLHTAAFQAESSSFMSSSSSGTMNGGSSSNSSGTKSYFASKNMCFDLLSVPGSQGLQIVIDVVVDALMALRRRPHDLLSLLSSHLVLGLPGASTQYDVGCMRSRLLLHVDADEITIRARFAAIVSSFLRV